MTAVRVAEIEARHRMATFAYEGQEAPQAHQDITWLLAEREELQGKVQSLQYRLQGASVAYSELMNATDIERAALREQVKELQGEVKAEDKSHRLTIDTFRQQERIWNQRFDDLNRQLATSERERERLAAEQDALHDEELGPE